MSLETWKAEFYPISADEVVESNTTLTAIVQHSLTKWQGLLPDNLEKHKCYIVGTCVCDGTGEELYIRSETCSLCALTESDCSICPLAMILGESCDDNISSPYSVFASYPEHDPKMMIKALKRTLRGKHNARRSHPS